MTLRNRKKGQKGSSSLLHSNTMGVSPVDPTIDLVPLCSNCHSMAHRQHGKILSVDELQALLRVGGNSKL